MKNMARIFILMVGLLVNVAVASAQDGRSTTKPEKKSTREAELRKQKEAVQDSINYVEAVAALDNLDFVLEADVLNFERGGTAFVSSTTNFVSLSDDEAVVQIAPYNVGGLNDIGGITVEGRAFDIKKSTSKKGDIYFSMSVQGNGISAVVDVSLPKGTNRASVTISPNFNSNRITLSGVLVPSSSSNVFRSASF